MSQPLAFAVIVLVVTLAVLPYVVARFTVRS